MSGNWGQILQNSVAGSFGSGDAYLRDFTHASKTFRSDSYANAPKLKFLFHTYFNINPEATIPYTLSNLGTLDTSTNFGLLVKEVKLPSYTFQTHTMNQYNRKRIIQSKIKYDSVDIKFHDDNKSTMTKLWEAYYTYYYNDGTRSGAMFEGDRGSSPNAYDSYNQSNLYNASIAGDENWGFAGGQTNQDSKTPRKIPFFKNITVFGFNQHSFVAYTLVNPVITNFSHDTYSYDTGNGIMENSMTIDYETVVYNYGNIDGQEPENIVTGFGDPATYDRELSPITPPGSNSMTLGNGGLVYADGGSLESPIQDEYATNILNSGTAYNSEKFPGLNVSHDTGLNVMLRDSERNTPTNRNSPFSFPSAGSSPGPHGLANSPVINALRNPPPVFNDPFYSNPNYGSTAEFIGDVDPAWEDASNDFGNFQEFDGTSLAGEPDIFGNASDPFDDVFTI